MSTLPAHLDHLDHLDHLVLATPDLTGTLAEFARQSGVTPAPGGSHPGFGTRNALVGLGPDSYLEIVGPDPEQPDPDGPRPFGIDDLKRATLVTWAIHPPDVDAVIARARRAGFDPGGPAPMSRHAPDGTTLNWRLTPPRGLVPFLIDWGATPHPASRDLPSVELASFELRHPDPGPVQRALEALRVPVRVEPGRAAALDAVLAAPKGSIMLRPSLR